MARLALITGGSRGLGAAFVAQLQAEGWEVVEFSRAAPHACSVKVDLGALAASGPVLDAKLAELAARDWDEVLAVLNAATLAPIGPTARKPPAEVLGNLDLNLKAPVLFAALFVKHFQRHAARKLLANISSGAALKGYAGWSLYCAAKAGLENHVRSIALEQAGEAHPVLAVNVDPGVMDTEMQAAIRATGIDDFPAVERFHGLQAAGMLRAPETVAVIILGELARVTEGGGRIDTATHR
ncbi:SDR family NAD(P)-dependent oxidoreductase [Derxia gummosa]|uniref:SDR family NAD(P)-dependent oxidoreductase n=1 Tax=Derxia gummosa DSM 723 TaxID=1121388 RepID=A0A8B6X8P9_9BURK|nr:SDR family NAD(P)-dependent oxidoreductase [Derxia gummosa]